MLRVNKARPVRPDLEPPRKLSAGLHASFVAEAIGLAFATGLHRSTDEFEMDPVTAQASPSILTRPRHSSDSADQDPLVLGAVYP